MALPDDLARIVLELVAANCETRISQVIDEGDVPSFTIEVIRSAPTRATACVCHQFARLMRRVVRSIGRRAYNATDHGDVHVVFIEIR